jgi:hypothetical protein
MIISNGGKEGGGGIWGGGGIREMCGMWVMLRRREQRGGYEG